MSRYQENITSSLDITEYAVRPIEDENGNIVVRYAYICSTNISGDWCIEKVYGREISSETWLRFKQEMVGLDRSQLKVEKWQVI